IEAAVLDRHLGRGHRQLHETVGPPDILRVLKEILRFEVPHLAGDLAIVSRNVESLDPADTAFAFNETFPKRFEIVPDGRNNTKTCNDNATIVIHEDGFLNRQRVPMPTLCTAWKSFPSVLIDGAMMISVCWNSGRLRAPTLPIQVVIAPTRFWLPSSTSAGPKRICFNEPVAPTLMRVPRGRLACGVAMPQW